MGRKHLTQKKKKSLAEKSDAKKLAEESGAKNLHKNMTLKTCRRI